MRHSPKLKPAVATSAAALALLTLAAPAAAAPKPVVSSEPPSGGWIVMPIEPVTWEPIFPCVCLPLPDEA
jgi:hypothetical protein